MRRAFIRPVLLCVAILSCSPLLNRAEAVDAADTNSAVMTPAYLDPEVPIPERVADLISRMTIPEKVAQMDIESSAIDRLCVPACNWWSEGIHGVGRAGRATMFPAAIGLAATWDTGLVHRVAEAIADEALAKHLEAPNARYHGLIYWAPCVNVVHDPRWGRIEESYGEDPYLTSRLAVAFIRGLQGDDPVRLKIAATAKHFGVHSQETGRHNTSFAASERVMREYYFPPFEASFREAHAVSCMVAFNGINGVPCTANHWLLTDVLRGEFGLDGPVVTDYGATTQLRSLYKLADSIEQAVELAVASGVDVISEPTSIRSNILAAAETGFLTEEQLDTSLLRSLSIRFRLGMFDPPGLAPYAPPWVLGCPAHLDLALTASRESLVLLKNAPVPGRADPTPLLPLDRRKLESVAVLGSHARRVALGAYSGQPAEPAVTTWQGLADHLGDRVVIRYAPWYDPDDHRKDTPEQRQSLEKTCLESAVTAAAGADVAVVVLGLSPKIENEGKDRLDIGLPKDQQEFVEKIVAVNPATVVVLINGGPLAVAWLQEHAPALLEAWYPGEQGGNAIAEALFGDFSPAGRLPMTFYASLDRVPPLDDYEISDGKTYLYLQDQPLYPFGYGLSYTTFDYRNLRLDRQTVATNGTAMASVAIVNTGARDGDEVAQLYVRALTSRVSRPLKQLCGFRRLHIPRGQTRTVTFPVAAADLGYWDDTVHHWVIEPGEFEIMIGASSGDLRQCATLRIE